MATLSEVLAKGAIPKKLNATLPRLKDPDTGEQFVLSFHVPNIVEYCDILYQYQGYPYLKQCIGIIDACLIDPNGYFTDKLLEDRCSDDKFDVTRMDIIGSVLRSEEIIKIATAIDNATMAGEERTPDEIIADLKGIPRKEKGEKGKKGSRRKLRTPDEIIAEQTKN